MADAKESAIPLQKILDNSDYLIAIGVVVIVTMLVVPLFTWLLNLFIVFNIAIGLVVILTVTYTTKALDFSVFPSLLLVTTLFRLAINVSSTRLILLKGWPGVEGIITAFGEFVVGGNYIVGIVIFLILVIIQFMVIVRGSTRIAEVAARFTLDAMPGKQMAIDADLNAGIITEQEANERRAEIRREADFYGAMDGASKFIQGDVIAGLIITVINILGGWAIGVWQRGDDFAEAAKTYTLLTVGDGLVSQIPALLISTATGIIVSRAASQGMLGVDLTTQMTREPKVLYIAGSAIALLGVGTPLATIPMLIIASMLITMGYLISSNSKSKLRKAKQAEADAQAEEIRRPEDVASLIKIDDMELEIGYGLIPLVAPEQGGDLLDRITLLRRQCALDFGVIVPPVRIRDNMQLKPNAYIVKIKGVEVDGGEVFPDKYLAMNPGKIDEKVAGIDTVEPAFGLPAVWITEEKREYSERIGYTVVDPPSIIATHLTEIIKRHAHDLLDRKTINVLVEKVKEDVPDLVDEVLNKTLSISDLQKVLQNLLREGISIRNLPVILEVLADKGRSEKDSRLLTEYVRMSLSREICAMCKDEEGKISVITLSPQLEREVAESIKESAEGSFIALDPIKSQKLIAKLGEVVNSVSEKGLPPIILVAPNIRPYFKMLVERSAPGLMVLSYNEIVRNIKVQSVGTVAV